MDIIHPPKKSHGFIYILSNQSMSGVYKVGLTTNSVLHRIQELSSTGVPTRFRAEKAFQIRAEYLKDVEKTIHLKLKEAGYHHGKEFFNCELSYLSELVEDVIHEATGECSSEIVGLAAARKAEKERKHAWYFRERERRRLLLKKTNEEIRKQRIEWVNKQVALDSSADSLRKFGNNLTRLFIVIALSGTAFSLFPPGPAFIALAASLIWWYLSNEAKHNERVAELRKKAEQAFPDFTLKDVPFQTYVPTTTGKTPQVIDNKQRVVDSRPKSYANENGNSAMISKEVVLTDKKNLKSDSEKNQLKLNFFPNESE